MRKAAKNLAIASALFVGLATVSALDARESQRSQGSMMGPGMMGQGGMMDMMKMMGQMNKMMAACNEMMQGAKDHHGSDGHDQKRGKSPMTPEKAE